MIFTRNLGNSSASWGLRFFGLSLGWLFLGSVIIGLLKPWDQAVSCLQASAILWGMSVVDLFVLQMLSRAIVKKAASSGEMTQNFNRRIAFWGILKTIWLGLFLLVLLKGQKFPLLGVLIGVGTLAFVPLGVGVFEQSRNVNEDSKKCMKSMA